MVSWFPLVYLGSLVLRPLDLDWNYTTGSPGPNLHNYPEDLGTCQHGYFYYFCYSGEPWLAASMKSFLYFIFYWIIVDVWYSMSFTCNSVSAKNWCFWTVVLEKTLRGPWRVRRSKQLILKKINLGYSSEGLMLKLKLQYFGHLMWGADSLEKTLMLGKIEDRKRRGQQRVRWLDGITDLMDMSLSKLWEIVKDREAWHIAVHVVTKRQTWLSDWTISKQHVYNILTHSKGYTPFIVIKKYWLRSIFCLICSCSLFLYLLLCYPYIAFPCFPLPTCSLYLWICFIFVIFTMWFYFLNSTYKV